MNVYRLSLSRYAYDTSGTGAYLFGGRWNLPGIHCLYASESRALAALEYAVNSTVKDISNEISMITLGVPKVQIVNIDDKQLPVGWNRETVNIQTQALGSRLFAEGKHAIIRLPSVIIPHEYNFIINPIHPSMKKLKILDVEPFAFDTRIKRG